MQITQDWQLGTIHLDQTEYVKQILQAFQMTDCKLASTPMEQGLALPSLDQDSPDTKLCLQYQMAIGFLMYAMIETQPDLAFSISKLSQYLSNPRDIHWNAIKQVLQNLRRSFNNGITY